MQSKGRDCPIGFKKKTTCCLSETHFSLKDKNRFHGKRYIIQIASMRKLGWL